ncbi:Carboxylesterase NlhH [Rubripirellula tenax]|uniref:Carboxylesterase NlhH n=2 Tax=Rubripirellula tenax TaxID=2528015 RepID=A0A5C6F8M7_9BACT|nr:Carboxylesterase NlhH [Rubripirellula tenax]
MRVALIAVSVFGMMLCQRAQSESPTDVTMHRDIVYAAVDGQQLKLDLCVPNVQHAPPLVVWIHGGGWRAGSRSSPRIAEIVESGFALASISYRFTDKAIFPAQIYDCKAAIRWLRAHATQFGYRSDSIAVAGSSAGGHLALLLGVSGDVPDLEGDVGEHMDQTSRVQAVIDYFGPSDFVLRGKTQPERAYTEKSGSLALLGGLRDGKVSEEVERWASPSQYVSADDPPLLIFHGNADSTVLLDQSERIASLYKDAGLDGRLVVLKNAGHGGTAFFRGRHFETAKQFLLRHCPMPTE